MFTFGIVTTFFSVVLAAAAFPQYGAAQENKAETGFAELNGTKIYYETNGSGETIIFMHAGLTDNRIWDEQSAYFSQYYKVLRYDSRGYGKSDRISEQFSQSEDLYNLMKYFDIEKAHLVGMSFNGNIAIEFTLLHPEMVLSLTAVTPALGGYQYPEEFQKYGSELFKIGIEQGHEKAMENIFTEPFWDYNMPRKSNPKAREKFKKIALENTHMFKNEFGMITNLDPPAIGRLHEIRVPTLVFLAEQDHSDNRKVAEIVFNGIKGAKIARVTKAGHLVNIEKPDEFNSILHEFLSQYK